jgi:hypothetical protein
MKYQAIYILRLLTQQILSFKISRQSVVEKKSDLCGITLFYFEMRACWMQT